MKHSFGRGHNRKPELTTVIVVKSPQTGNLLEFHIVLWLCDRMALQVSAPIKAKKKLLYWSSDFTLCSVSDKAKFQVNF